VEHHVTLLACEQVDLEFTDGHMMCRSTATSRDWTASSIASSR
jgi:hypothetical protein